ncbi:MAG: SPOR domain-containing protein [Acidobacteria bacterium]|nr:SPOR domain-containing protein [Acidobacteriota bacterium]
MIKNTTLDQRQRVVLFISGVTLCAIFFAFGLFIGKWSSGEAMAIDRTETQGSLLLMGSEPQQPASDTNQSAIPTQEETTGSTSGQAKMSDLPDSQAGLPANSVEATGSPSEPLGGTGAGQTPASVSSAPEENLGTPTHFYVRAGTFEESQQAEDFAAVLRSRGFVSAYTETEKTDAGKTRYLVLLGPWVDRDSAARTMNELRNEGVSNVTIIGQR